MQLKTGTSKTLYFTVTPQNTAVSMKSGALEVYATPMMIAAMEETCMELAAEGLDPGSATVGTLVNINHLAPSPVGASVSVRGELVEVDGRRLVFKVSASDSEDLIGEGTHERFVVDTARFMDKVEAKKSRI